MSIPAFLVFDLDGTISDPAVGIYRSMNYALEHFGHKPISANEISKYIGPPLDLSFSAITGITSTQEISSLVSKYRERYSEIGFAENSLYAGVVDALQALASDGVPIGLCTSKRVDFAERVLQLFGIRQHFRFLSGGEIGIKKQDQLKSLLASETIARSSIMIGDRAVDIEAANANGMASVGVLWGHGSEQELVAANPQTLLSSPHQLIQLRNAV